MKYTISYTKWFPSLADKIACPVCNQFFHKGSLQRHVRNQHGTVHSASCSICGATLKNDEGLKDHMRQKHKIYQSGPF